MFLKKRQHNIDSTWLHLGKEQTDLALGESVLQPAGIGLDNKNKNLFD